MRLARLALSAAVAATALTGTAPANAAVTCSAHVSIDIVRSGETNAFVTATLDGGCAGPRDEMYCLLVLVGPLGVVKAAEGGGVTTEGCFDSQVFMQNGIQGGAYTAIGLVDHAGSTPAVGRAVAVA